MLLDGIPYGPVKVTSSDANAALPAAVVTESVYTANTRNAIRVIITCEDNPIRYGFGIIPVQGAAGHILYPGSSIVLGHPQAISLFRYINLANAANAVLQITGEYGA
jgi:hypothetical protein